MRRETWRIKRSNWPRIICPRMFRLAEIAVTSGRIREAVIKYDTLAETAEVRRDLPKAISFYKQALQLMRPTM